MPILPVEAYTSQAWFDREMREIFSRTWQFAGLIEDVAEPGAYFTVQAGLNNLLVVRGHDQRLRAFHNICRHRGTQLLRTAGKAEKAITCPYHDWTYSLNGQLLSVPAKEREFPDLDIRTVCLKKASVETWNGLLWVHPDPEAELLMDFLAGAQDRVGPHRVEELIEWPQGRATEVFRANWKIVVENFIDVYHLAHLHSNTLYMYDHAKAVNGWAGPHYLFWEPHSEDYGASLKMASPLPLIDHIPEDQLGAFAPMLFPNIGLSATEGSWSTFHIKPVGPAETHVEVRTKVANASGWAFTTQAARSAMWPGWRRLGGKYDTGDKDDPMASGNFMAEDIYACEQQQKSLQSPYFEVGFTSVKGEDSVRQFQRVVAEWLGEDLP
ncbi:MAG: aromatic ring-hydroxylating dioxygenase subunit alpha [Bacteroidota bacterium]